MEKAGLWARPCVLLKRKAEGLVSAFGLVSNCWLLVSTRCQGVEVVGAGAAVGGREFPSTIETGWLMISMEELSGLECLDGFRPDHWIERLFTTGRDGSASRWRHYWTGAVSGLSTATVSATL